MADKTAMTDTVNALRTKHGLHCATNQGGMTPPRGDATDEERAAYKDARVAYRSDVRAEVRKMMRRAASLAAL